MDIIILDITKNLNYVIYEHDHKYLDTRNPAVYKNFIAPKESIVNLSEYAIDNEFIAFAIGAQFFTKRMPNDKAIELIK